MIPVAPLSPVIRLASVKWLTMSRPCGRRSRLWQIRLRLLGINWMETVGAVGKMKLKSESPDQSYETLARTDVHGFRGCVGGRHEVRDLGDTDGVDLARPNSSTR